ncbi:MAG: HEAT repeat domain-containing protein [Planctomycetota bacterium]
MNSPRLAAAIFFAILSLALASAAGAGEGPSDDLNALQSELSSQDPNVRLTACEKIWRMDPGDASVLAPELGRAMGDRDVRVRRMAAQTLCGMGPGAAKALDAIGKGIFDRDKEVIRLSCLCAWRLGTLAKPLLPTMWERLERLHKMDEIARILLEGMKPFARELRDRKDRVLAWSAHEDPGVSEAAGKLYRLFHPPGADRDALLEGALSKLHSGESRTRGRAAAILQVFGGEPLKKAQELYALPPGKLEFAVMNEPNHCAPGKEVSWQILGENNGTTPFWIPVREITVHTVNEEFTPCTNEIQWGGVCPGRRGLRVSHGDAARPRFPLEPFQILGPGRDIVLGSGGNDTRDEMGWSRVKLSVAAKNEKGPYGIRPWTGSFACTLTMFFIEPRHWEEGELGKGGLSMTVGPIGKVSPGAEFLVPLDFENVGKEPLTMPALWETQCTGIWAFVAGVEGKVVKSLQKPGPDRSRFKLGHLEQGLLLEPGAGYSTKIPVRMPLEPGNYRLKIGFGRFTNPKKLQRDDSRLWTGELASRWTVFEVVD